MACGHCVLGGLSALVIEDVRGAGEVIVGAGEQTRPGRRWRARTAARRPPACTAITSGWRRTQPAGRPPRAGAGCRVRRMRCPVTGCPRQTSGEQVPGVIDRYLSGAPPCLAGQVSAVGHLSYSGQSRGARLLQALGIPVSRHAALRDHAASPARGGGTAGAGGRLKRAPARPHYATVLIEIETGRPVDLLPGRDPGLLAEWLRSHPGVQVVCRDLGPTLTGILIASDGRALPGLAAMQGVWMS